MIRAGTPNFFRLYLNLHVVQTCFCLQRYVRTTWPAVGRTPYQTFLANSFTEALSGAIKLARYVGNLQGRPAAGLIVDARGRLDHFATSVVEGEGTVEYIPELTIVGDRPELEDAVGSGTPIGFVALVGSVALPCEGLQRLLHEQSPLLIRCVDRPGLAACRDESAEPLRAYPPDIVVFDESFVNNDVPWAAITARKDLFEHWNRLGQGAFHSTTFQPNTVSNLHFLRCLAPADPRFHAEIAAELEWIERDPEHCLALLGSLYSPFLARAIAATGFDTPGVEARGHYVSVKGRKVFDGVAGVACSVRGHNPESYVADLEGLSAVPDEHEELSAQLYALTGLGQLVPAVSGASAVENALRLGLAAQFPRRRVVAFHGGFGGKTLLALTGTAREFYKSRLGPLYEHVVYLDPFADDVLDVLEATLADEPVAVVQLELIQGVGGVRPLPERVLRYLQAERQRGGYLLFVDEVQTSMYRTGPFVRSTTVGLTPDLLTVGKGTSDMMFPIALTLYSDAVQRRLDKVQPELPRILREQHGYITGYRTVRHTLRYAEREGLEEQVAEAGALFSRLLAERLSGCKAVRDIRVFGLLIGIELATTGWPRRWLRKKLAPLYVLKMLRHSSFPLLIGYCQYEPQVLKLTPPLSITPQEVRQVCETIASTLSCPLHRLLPSSLVALARSALRRRRPRQSDRVSAS
jgi:acetylornithine/succinyldiaminopimelate/putrescine aminotransferase